MNEESINGEISPLDDSPSNSAPVGAVEFQKSLLDDPEFIASLRRKAMALTVDRGNGDVWTNDVFEAMMIRVLEIEQNGELAEHRNNPAWARSCAHTAALNWLWKHSMVHRSKGGKESYERVLFQPMPSEDGDEDHAPDEVPSELVVRIDPVEFMEPTPVTEKQVQGKHLPTKDREKRMRRVSRWFRIGWSQQTIAAMLGVCLKTVQGMERNLGLVRVACVLLLCCSTTFAGPVYVAPSKGVPPAPTKTHQWGNQKIELRCAKCATQTFVFQKRETVKGGTITHYECSTCGMKAIFDSRLAK